MNPMKAAIKIGTINELGSKCDDMLEAAQREIHRNEGVRFAIGEIQQKTLKSVFERVDADRDSGKFDVSVAGLIKDYLSKVHAALDNLQLANERHRLLAEGRVIGLKDAVGFAKKLLDAEKAKLESLPETAGELRPDSNVSAVKDLNERRALARVTREAPHAPAAPVLALAAESNPPRGGRAKGARSRPKQAGT